MCSAPDARRAGSCGSTEETRPSVTDIKIANEWEENWSRLNLSVPIYMLISLMDKARPDVRAYWIQNASVSSADVVTDWNNAALNAIR